MYTLKDLIDKSYNALLECGLSHKTVYGSNWYIWNRLVREYGEDAIFEERMVYNYCLDYFNKDIFNTPKNKLVPVERRYRIAFIYLINMNKDILPDKFNYHYVRNYKLSERCQRLLDNYIQFSEQEGNSKITIRNKRMRIKFFMVHSDFDHLTKDSIVNYLIQRQKNMCKIAYSIDARLIRRFLLFCYENGELDKEILLACPARFRNTYGKTIPSAFSVDEINQLLLSAKEYTREDNHLRNYSILCLLAYSGIRANDVRNLELSNIDWKENSIKFIQQKTKRIHVIPLIPEIGNPIVNYLLNERPKSDSNYLFLTENGNQMKNTQQITSIINVYFSNSPIDLRGRHFGAHALRHSVASNLINSDISAFSVANVLGHSNIDCVHIYAKVDVNGLRKCVLEAPYEA